MISSSSSAGASASASASFVLAPVISANNSAILIFPLVSSASADSILALVTSA